MRERRILTISSLVLLAHLSCLPNSLAQESGQQNYQALCAPCHTIGAGRLIGPDLAGVHERRSQQWLFEFVQSSQSMIARGDPDAVALFEEYSNLPMPDAPLSEAQITEVLAYMSSAAAAVAAGGPPVVLAPQTAGVETTSQPAETPVTVPPADRQAPTAPPSEAEILLGQDLFQGLIRLENRGPACNSCHEAVNDAVMGGGSLSVDLTTAFSRLGGPGLQAMLGTSPYPVMQAAYQGRALTENEVSSLVSFLQNTDAQSAFQTPRNYGLRLFLSGLVGALLLFGFFSFVWRGRKRGSVNQAVFDRQVESTWEN